MKTGDQVVCVKSHSNSKCPLKIRNIYIILAVKCCPCGQIAFDVGIELPPSSTNTYCIECKKRTFGRTWWIGSSLFRPLQYNSVHEELINKLNETKEEKLDVPIKEPAL